MKLSLKHPRDHPQTPLGWDHSVSGMWIGPHLPSQSGTTPHLCWLRPPIQWHEWYCFPFYQTPSCKVVGGHIYVLYSVEGYLQLQPRSYDLGLSADCLEDANDTPSEHPTRPHYDWPGTDGGGLLGSWLKEEALQGRDQEVSTTQPCMELEGWWP